MISGKMESRMEQYEIMEQIGRGAFGAAILVNHKLERKKYVLKKIRLARQTERCRKSAHQEMALIARLKHPFVVEFKEAWVEKGCFVCIVTGYCEGGDMAELMKKAHGQYFPEEKLLKWFTQLLLAVEYLHSNFVLHRDVKCSNIFLTKDQDIRLGDFGLAKTMKADDLASSVVGTPNYMCPELLADIPYGFKSDIWSLGCCMYEMAAHRRAFRASDMGGLISKINRSAVGPLPQCYSPSLKMLIKSMLQKNPEHRSSASEILKHAFLQPYINQHSPSHILASPPSTNTISAANDSLIPNAMQEKADSSPAKSMQNGERSYVSKQPKVIKNIIMALKEGKSREITSPPKDYYHAESSPKVTKSGRVDSGFKANPETPRAASVSSAKRTSKSPLVETPPKAKFRHEVSPPTQEEISIRQNVTPILARTSSFPARMRQHGYDTEKVKTGRDDAEDPEQAKSVSNCFIKHHESHCKSRNYQAIEEDTNESTLNCSTPSSHSERLESSARRYEVDQAMDLSPVLHTEVPYPNTDKELLDSSVTDSSSFTMCPISSDSSNSAQPNRVEKEEALVGETLDVKSFEQRADALEGLLELSAELLKQKRLEELAVVLKPFGKEKVSPRDTVIWLAKSIKEMMLEENGRLA